MSRAREILKLRLKMTLGFIFFTFLSLNSHANTSVLTDQCINSLSSGSNWYGARVNKEALRKLAEGLKRYSKVTTNKERALLIDYSLNSKEKRSFLVNLTKCDLDAYDYVIHGGHGTRQFPNYFHGDKNHDGMLDRCVTAEGSRKFMTRPGFMVTDGYHKRGLPFPLILENYTGVKLRGLEARNSDVYRAAVVLHEHNLIHENSSVKPVGQGCPTFAQGILKNMLRYKVADRMLVYIHAPQCGR